MTKYKWREHAATAGIPASEAVQELKRIEKTYGSLTAENVLKASKNKNAVLYNIFVWDDSVAANRFRLRQANDIINDIQVVVISNGEEVSVPIYEIVARGEKQAGIFKSFGVMTIDELEQVKKEVIDLLERAKTKLKFYSQYEDIVKALGGTQVRLRKKKKAA